MMNTKPDNAPKAQESDWQISVWWMRLATTHFLLAFREARMGARALHTHLQNTATQAKQSFGNRLSSLLVFLRKSECVVCSYDVMERPNDKAEPQPDSGHGSKERL